MSKGDVYEPGVYLNQCLREISKNYVEFLQTTKKTVVCSSIRYEVVIEVIKICDSLCLVSSSNIISQTARVIAYNFNRLMFIVRVDPSVLADDTKNIVKEKILVIELKKAFLQALPNFQAKDLQKAGDEFKELATHRKVLFEESDYKDLKALYYEHIQPLIDCTQ